MAELPPVGAPVTIVLQQTGGAGHREVRQNVTHTADGKQLRPHFLASANQGHLNFLDDEGTTWLRGHVPLDAPEVKALLASYALDTHFGPIMCGTQHPTAAKVYCQRPANIGSARPGMHAFGSTIHSGFGYYWE